LDHRENRTLAGWARSAEPHSISEIDRRPRQDPQPRRGHARPGGPVRV